MSASAAPAHGFRSPCARASPTVREPGHSASTAKADVFVLQSQEPEGWLDLYAFTREPQFAVDYVLGNHFTATHPHSPFVQNLIVQKGSLSSRLSLRNRELTEVTALGTTVATLADDDGLLDLLADRFGLELPPETRFPRLAPA